MDEIPSLAPPALVATLTGSAAPDHAAARAALAGLATGPVDDLGPTVTAVIAALAEIPAGLRAEVLVWLADAQVGGHRAQTVRPPERKRRDQLPADRAPARAAVADGADAIASYLADPDPDVRSAAALALGFCPDLGAAGRAALAERLAPEAVVGVDAGIILALVRVGAGFRAPIDDPAIAAAIAVATAFDGPPNLDALLAAARLGPVAHLAFGGGDLGTIAATIAVEHAFGPPVAAPTPRLHDDLSGVQRQVLEGTLPGPDQIDWYRLGLPPTVDGRRRFLFLDPPGPTDRFVPRGDAEVPLWFALRADDGDRDALLAALTPTERLVVYLDRATYGLDDAFPSWQLDELLAELGADRADAAAELDRLVAAPRHGPLGAEVARAVAATRAPTAPPAEA